MEGRAEGRIEGRAEGRSEGILETLASLVKDGLISLAEAAKRSNMTVSEFEDKTGLKA
jgi:predicted transposase YdaD